VDGLGIFLAEVRIGNDRIVQGIDRELRRSSPRRRASDITSSFFMAINWSGIDSTSVVGGLMRAPLRMLPGRTLMTIRRGPSKGMKWLAGSANHGCWLGTYELAKQNALLRFAKKGMTIFDVGAQAGFFTMFFSRIVGDAGSVVAFEPCPDESRNLLTHLRVNRLTNVRVISAALSDRSSLESFSVNGAQTENALCCDSSSPLLVSAVALDDLNLPPPDLIKMDIEGGETRALKGARRILDRYSPVVFVALHGESQRRECAAILRELSYQLFDLSGRRIEGVPETDEIYALKEPLQSAQQENR
jgi:FkbM family methyltransferase